MSKMLSVRLPLSPWQLGLELDTQLNLSTYFDNLPRGGYILCLGCLRSRVWIEPRD